MFKRGQKAVLKTEVLLLGANMTQVRCPKCNRLLGYFKGTGEIQCPRCRKENKVYFDTQKKIVIIRAS